MLLLEISQIHGSGIILLPKLEVGVLASVRYSVFPGISFFTFGLKPTVCLMTSQSLFKPEESGTSTWMCRIFLYRAVCPYESACKHDDLLSRMDV